LFGKLCRDVSAEKLSALGDFFPTLCTEEYDELLLLDLCIQASKKLRFAMRPKVYKNNRNSGMFSFHLRPISFFGMERRYRDCSFYVFSHMSDYSLNNKSFLSRCMR